MHDYLQTMTWRGFCFRGKASRLSSSEVTRTGLSGEVLVTLGPTRTGPLSTFVKLVILVSFGDVILAPRLTVNSLLQRVRNDQEACILVRAETGHHRLERAQSTPIEN